MSNYRTSLSLLARRQGYEFWTTYDEEAKLFVLWLDKKGANYLGDFDTIAEARAYIPTWLEDKQ